MKTIAVWAFYFYWLWAPILTIAVVVNCLKQLAPRPAAIPSLLLVFALPFVAGPVAIDGPLPGFMPWWAVDVIARGLPQQSYVAHYAVALVVVFAVGLVVKAARSHRS